MRKEEQKAINEKVLKAIEEFNTFAGSRYASYITGGKKLRNCSAVVFELERYYVLKSYSTIIAIIDKETDTLYDFLRYVYGYTATSAQHISKFDSDYSSGAWKSAEHLIYRNI